MYSREPDMDTALGYVNEEQWKEHEPDTPPQRFFPIIILARASGVFES